MHLGDDEVEALLCVGFVVENKLASHVVELKEFDSNRIAVCDKHLMLARVFIALRKFL